MARLDRLLRPSSVAVIGGGTWCASVIEQCRKVGFQGQIWPVHPTRAEVNGIATCSSVRDLPASPDAAFVGVNRHASVEVVQALAQIGAGGAVCFASGFSEAEAELSGGSDLQAALLRAAGDMTILGPNCYGFVNALDGAALWPDMHGMARCERGVAIITQSSNLSINLTMQQRGLPIAYMVTAGNQAQTGMSEIGRALLADPRVSALGLHIEGIDDLASFIDLARQAQSAGKPIVVLKVGTSAQAQAAMVSHTASLAGSDAGARALFKRLGIGQVSSPSIFLETLKVLHVTGGLATNRIMSVSCSGGEASLMADLGATEGLDFPPLAPQQTTALRDVLGAKVALANPLDYHTYIWGDKDATTACFTAMAQGDVSMGCVVLDFPRPDQFAAPDWDKVVDAAIAAHAATATPMSILASLPETMPEAVATSAIENGVVPLCGMQDGLAAIACAARIGPTDTDVLLPGKPKGASVLSEAEAKSALANYGLARPKSIRLTRETLADAAQLGFPLVLKGEGLAHKTEAGAVALGLASETDLLKAGERMPGETFLAEQMITGGVAELLVGVHLDPAHGYVLTLSAGGILTEIMADSATLLLPVSRDHIRRALTGLRMFPLLKGYRGKPGAKLEPIIDAICAVQAYVVDHRDTVLEIEINPLICTPDAAFAVDALIRQGDTS